MKTSDFFFRTRRERPADAEVISHQLMLRSGMIYRVAAGIYGWLPLGLRVLRKIEHIVREQMDLAGAQELLLPALHPAELWEKSGRWYAYGPELLRITDRTGRSFCYAPTHEEAITDLASKWIDSPKQLPRTLYQIQWKFRDEIRPRFGVMRAREFLMKDAYSFDLDEQAMVRSYQAMFDAYQKCLSHMGLRFCSVEADSGVIGGNMSREFHILSHSAGENRIARCLSCGFHSNAENLRFKPAHSDAPPYSAPSKMRQVATPDIYTIDDLERQYQLPTQRSLKTLIVFSGHQAAALLLRGDHELNFAKAQAIEGLDEAIRFATQDEIQQLTGSIAGSLGPIGLDIPIYADFSTRDMVDMSFGANKPFWHYFDANWEIDLPLPTFCDLRVATEQDPCPDCGNALEFVDGIEVGHIFQLGCKYSEKMNATLRDAEGNAVPLWMGCYGIGISRMVAATIEQHHDDEGIIWPMPVAPFQVHIIVLSHDPSVQEQAQALYQQLGRRNLEVLLDDRDERAGVMFSDAQLLGIPYLVIVGKKALKSGLVEIRARDKPQHTLEVELHEAKNWLKARVERDLNAYMARA